MRHIAYRAFGAVAALVLLSSCAGAPIISSRDYDSSYSTGETGGQDLAVYVQGNAFGIPQPDFVRAVVDAMQGSTSGQPTRFVVPVPGQVPVYRVIMDFSGGNTTGSTACARPPSVPAAAPAVGTTAEARVPLLAVLCRGDSSLAVATGTIGAAGGPQGEAFRSGVSAFTLALFPAVATPIDRMFN